MILPKDFFIKSKVWITFLLLSVSVVSSAQDYLFGLTQKGGIFDQGVAFQINTDGTGYLVYGDFDGNNGGNAGNGSGFIQVDHDQLVTTLSALTFSGDQNLNNGMRVDIRPGQGGLIPPFRFQFSSNGTGFNPSGRFLKAFDGKLYAMTSTRGGMDGGTLFSAPSIMGNGPQFIISFDGVNNGKSPKGSLIQGPDGLLFGMTEFGGTNNQGIIFSYNILTAQFKKLHTFNGSFTGANPTGNLVLASNGKLYGMTRSGGVSNGGVVFSVNIDGSEFTKLIDLNATTGSSPLGSLVEYTDGRLYGMTSEGGADGLGTIFHLSLAGVFTKFVDFNGANGKSPVGDLVVATSGDVMYGVTYSGGLSNEGVLFKLQGGNQFIKLFDFDKTSGSNPVGTLMMNRKSSDISFTEIGQKFTTSEPFTPDVQTSSGLPIYLVSSHPDVARIENGKIKIVGQGGVYITAYTLGNHEYLPRSITKSFTVDKTNQTIQFPEIPNKIFGDAPFSLTATSSAGLPVSFTAFSNDVIDYNGSVFTIKNAGTVTIRAVQDGNAIYNPAEESRTLVVLKAEQTIDFSLAPDYACCSDIELKATSSSKIPMEFKTKDWEKLKIEGSVASIFGLGVAEIVAYNEGNRNYKPAEKSVIVNLLKGSQSISFTIPSTTFKFGDPSIFINSRSTSNLPVTYTSNPSGVAIFDGSYLRFVGVGTTTITATQEGNALIDPALSVIQTVTVDPPATPGSGNTITWTWNGTATKFINDPPFNLDAYASSGLPITYTSSDPSIAQVSGNLVIIKGVGTTTISAKQVGDATVPAATQVDRVLQINKKNQYIYLPSLNPVAFGVSPIPLPSRSSEGLPLSYTTSNSQIAFVDDDYQLHVASSGTITVTASQGGNEKFLPANSVSQNLTIAPLHQNIAFNLLPEKTFGESPFNISATASSGLPVEFTSSNSQVATITGTLVTVHGAGTTIIKARQNGYPGYSNYEMTRELIVKKAPQTISFAELPKKKFSDDPFYLNATANTGLPITYLSTNTSVAKISGNKVTIVGAGQVEIIASCSESLNHLATDAKQLLTISDAGNTFDIFGSTSFGGENRTGTLFRMKSDGANYSIVKNFEPYPISNSSGGFIKGSDGKMYANFLSGGTFGQGAIVCFDGDGTNMKVLHNFVGSTGIMAMGNLYQASDGNLYGMTQSGGLNKGGTVFSLKTDGTGYTVLKNLGGVDGALPIGGVMEATDGKLYGMTSSGGFFGSGTIFCLNKDGSQFKVIFRFNNNLPIQSGYGARGDLIQGADGYLYGTLSSGGENGKGVLFKINTDGTGFTKLVKFDGTTKGASPGSTILIASDGKIYGVTQMGGSSNLGLLFSVNTDGSGFSQLLSFNGVATGSYSACKLTEGSDGRLYGMATAGGANSVGTIFSVNKNGTEFQKLADFDDRAASPFFGPLLESQTGIFFGITPTGSGGLGAVFKITTASDFSIVKDFKSVASTPRGVISDPFGEFYFGFVYGGIFRISETNEYQLIHEFQTGFYPSQLVYQSEGYLLCYGTINNQVFVFRMRPDGSGYEVLDQLNSDLPAQVQWLTETGDGGIFGITIRGDQPRGIVFSAESDGTGFTELGYMPFDIEFIRSSFLRTSEGHIYALSGYTGELFRLDSIDEMGEVQLVTTLPEEIGQVPMKLIEMNGGSIGVIMRSNAIFSVEKDGTGYTKIFEQTYEQGANPEDMIQTFDGWLYVVAGYGGANDRGVIYKIKSDGSAYTPIHTYNYVDGDSPNFIQFKKLQQSISFDPISVKTVSDSPFKPIASSSSGARIIFTSSNPSVAVIEDGLIKPVGVGSAVITASIPANPNYYQATSVQRELVVAKGSQLIDFDNPGDKTLGDMPFAISATVSSGLPVSFKTFSQSIFLSGSVVTLQQAGLATIEAVQAGNSLYDAAIPVVVTFCVNPPKPIISLLGSGSQAVLSSSNDNGNTWYRNGELLDGESGKTISANESGNYSVITSIEGCSSLSSDNYTLTITSAEPVPVINVRVSPNPVSQMVFVKVTGHDLNTTLELIDVMGKTITSQSLAPNGTHTFDMSELTKGLYLLKVTSGKKINFTRLIKQ